MHPATDKTLYALDHPYLRQNNDDDEIKYNTPVALHPALLRFFMAPAGKEPQLVLHVYPMPWRGRRRRTTDDDGGEWTTPGERRILSPMVRDRGRACLPSWGSTRGGGRARELLREKRGGEVGEGRGAQGRERK